MCCVCVFCIDLNGGRSLLCNDLMFSYVFSTSLYYVVVDGLSCKLSNSSYTKSQQQLPPSLTFLFLRIFRFYLSWSWSGPPVLLLTRIEVGLVFIPIVSLTIPKPSTYYLYLISFSTCSCSFSHFYTCVLCSVV
jgi:hypothetical protein